MRRFSIFTCTMLMTGIMVIFTKAEEQQAPVPVITEGKDTSTQSPKVLEQETFFLINQYRKENKLPVMQWDEAITNVARVHSRDMATGEVDFGHGGFTDRVNKLKTVMIGLKNAGENVLESDDPTQLAQRAVALWLKSPAHLHNIRGDYNYSGLGVWENKQGTIYFTQIFVKIQPRAQPVQAPPQVVSPLSLLAQPQTRDR